MSSQIFKSEFPNDILYNLLNEIHFQKTNKCYVINNGSFKSALAKGLLVDFCNTLKESYHISKQFYITRQLDYTKFATVLRQICNNNHISFTTQIKYDKSSYDIHYFIYY
jgi:hypothetical protein